MMDSKRESRIEEPQGSSSSNPADSQERCDDSYVKRDLYVVEATEQWDLSKIIRELWTREQCINFAEVNGLVLREKLCNTHQTPMKVTLSTNNSMGAWVCSKKKCRGTSRKSRTIGTFFENVKIDLRHVFYLIYAYAHMWSYDKVIHEDPLKEQRKLCLSRATIADWYNYCREVVVIYHLRQLEQNLEVKLEKIGGPGKIVQIDELKFNNRKYNLGRHIEGYWVLGMIEDESEDLRLEVCSDDILSAEVLVPLIRKHVELGTTIRTDGWRAYNCLGNNGYHHHKINHSDPEKPFVAQDSTQTQKKDTQWKAVKKFFKILNYNNRENLEDLIVEYMWRKMIDKNKKDPFVQVINAINVKYPTSCNQSIGKVKMEKHELNVPSTFGTKRNRSPEKCAEINEPKKVKLDVTSENNNELKCKAPETVMLEVKNECKNEKTDEINGNHDCTLNNNVYNNKIKEEPALIEGEDQEKRNLEKCDICGQYLNNSDIIYFQGHPQNAIEEFVALTNEKLVLSSGDEGDIMERPQTNITGFSIFDQQGHLCPIDGGLIENDVRIYMSGYLKSICSDSQEIDEESVPVKDVGPIIEWYIHGFDGGTNNCITLSTEFGEYNLLKPSLEYTPLMNNLYEKIWLSKVVVEYLEEYHYLLPTYEDLLEVVRESKIPELDDKKMSEEMLHKHAQFVCDQVVSLEADEDYEPLITLPCMRELIKLMGIKFGKRRINAKIDYKKVDKKAWTKATTTPLVRKTFESFFTNQLDKTNHELVLRRKRCGICEACQLPDCGECNACRAMAKFGGHGRTKKACVRRLCPNMAVEQAEDSEPDDEEDYQLAAEKRQLDKIDDTLPVKLTGSNNRHITWLGEPVKADATKVYYDRVEIDGAELKNGDFVMVETSQSNIPSLVARITYMWKEIINSKSGFFHGEVFIRSSDTVLGEVGDPREVFLGDRCCHGAPLSSILRKACVERIDIPQDWFKLGGKEIDENLFEDDGKTYFYKKYYERFTARFEDLPVDPLCPNELRKHRFCPSCERKTRKDARDIPKISGKLTEKSSIVQESNRTEWTSIRWREYDYKKGCGVFLKPGTFKFKNNLNNNFSGKHKLEKVDENIYPEYYRKSDNYTRGSNVDTGEPFCVGYIAAITAAGEGPLVVPQDIYIKVNVLYRPENTTSRFPQHEDLNVVYWSDEIKEVSFSAVEGPCEIVYIENIPQPENIYEWLEGDPNRMYFRMAFNKSSGQLEDLPNHARSIGRTERGKDKGKGKGKSSKATDANVTKSQNVSVRPLRTLDVFAGCGGLSEGLHRARVAECKWAIENLEAAAHAYALNNKNCTVFNEDCNALLKDAMSGATHSAGGLRLPCQGEVELLCGGPPCQGFSGMNRFNSREYSNFKNSLVASYLSYCDYYRPKYFILENVRNFVAFKKGMVLKLTLRALLDMGYQCTFGVLQAGNYGVPQTRRRLIILAAAPGYDLPLYPEPTHVFSRRACSLTTTIDGKKFVTNIQWDESAPRRTCTIQDAMSDLPQICNGANKIEIDYASMPETYFQRLVRSKDESVKLRDHICKNMAPLITARISRIPTTPGSDWRDLPNTSVLLSDGTKCKVLQYRYEDKKNGRSSTGALRGVCACAAGGPCSPGDKQENTLIPWCLPHTANRHNNWAGLYGRVSWDGYFSTTVTDPEPMGKQGRVLHPEQSRVVSVRECARSQGFPDTYLFAGSIQDKHRQVGNAVPPPLGLALGREIKKALCSSKIA